MKLTTFTAIIALLAAPVHATDVPETPEPPTVTEPSGGNDNAAAIGVAVLLGVLIWGATRNRESSSAVMHSPRPLVRPEPSYDKLVEGE